MTDFNLVMISAVYENGGNTTHRLLDGHPDLRVYPFESQLGTGLASDHLASYVPIRYRWPEFSMRGDVDADYEAFWDEELKTYLRARSRSKFRDCGLVMDETRRRARYAEIVGELGRSRRNNVEALFRATFDTWEGLRSDPSARYAVGYSPVLVLDAEKFFEDFPDGHMVHVVRNPFAGFADQFRRPFPPSLSRYAHTWSYCQTLALTYHRMFPRRFHILRFEDLVSDRESTLRGLFTALGLPFSPSCLVPSFNGAPLTQVAPWGTIRTPTMDENIATAKELTNAQRDRVAALTAVPRYLLGYERFFDAGQVDAIRF